MSLTAEQYLARTDPAALFARLRAADPASLQANIRHFTEHEGHERDRIVLGYLGDSGVRDVARAVAEALLPAGAMNPQPAILDVGAGSGFFTGRAAEALRARGLRPRMFAMDATPAMLRALGNKPFPAVPFLGLMEDLEGSVREAAKVQPVPALFDGAMSTLALHHCPDPEGFFRGAARVLGFGAPMVVVDLVAHDHREFREVMDDIHLGFEPKQLEAMALEHFSEAKAEVLPDACCTGEGEPIRLFALTLRR